MVAAFLERIPVAELGRIDDRSPEIGREKKLSAAELRRGHSDDGKGMLVDLHSPAHSRRVPIKLAVPERIAQDDLGHAVRPVFFGSVDKSSKIGLNAERIEVITADGIGPDHGRISVANIEPDSAHDV